MHLTIIIRPGDVSGYVAECPALPGCVSQGATLAETRANIRAAIRDILGVMNEDAHRRARKSSCRIAEISI